MQIMIGMQLKGAAYHTNLFHLHCYLDSCSGERQPTKKAAKGENDKDSIFSQNVPLTAHTPYPFRSLARSPPLWTAVILLAVCFFLQKKDFTTESLPVPRLEVPC